MHARLPRRALRRRPPRPGARYAAPMPDLVLACVVAFAASILGGLSGFGTGLILPVFLVPVVGVENVVPVMAVGMLFANGGRVAAFRHDVRWDHARRVLVGGLPACALGAWVYTRLPEDAIALLLGGFLLAAVPLRRVLARAGLRLSARGEALAGTGFGFVNGGLTGAGVLLIATLMAAGVQGAALIATDAVVSLAMGLLKVAAFGGLDALDMRLAGIGLAIGACTVPGGFVARRLLERIPAGVHAWVMEAVVVAGALALVARALR